MKKSILALTIVVIFVTTGFTSVGNSIEEKKIVEPKVKVSWDEYDVAFIKLQPNSKVISWEFENILIGPLWLMLPDVLQYMEEIFQRHLLQLMKMGEVLHGQIPFSKTLQNLVWE